MMICFGSGAGGSLLIMASIPSSVRGGAWPVDKTLTTVTDPRQPRRACSQGFLRIGRFLDRVHSHDPAPDPCEHRHGHAVADGAVSRRIFGEPPAIRDQRVIFGKTLKRLAFSGHQSPHRR